MPAYSAFQVIWTLIQQESTQVLKYTFILKTCQKMSQCILQVMHSVLQHVNRNAVQCNYIFHFWIIFTIRILQKSLTLKFWENHKMNYADDTQSRNLSKKLAQVFLQVSCIKFWWGSRRFRNFHNKHQPLSQFWSDMQVSCASPTVQGSCASFLTVSSALVTLEDVLLQQHRHAKTEAHLNNNKCSS